MTAPRDDGRACWYCHAPLRFPHGRCRQCGESNDETPRPAPTQGIINVGDVVRRRWFVYVGSTRFVTWAPTADDARAKTEQRMSLRRLRLKVDRVEPAPPLVDGAAR